MKNVMELCVHPGASSPVVFLIKQEEEGNDVKFCIEGEDIDHTNGSGGWTNVMEAFLKPCFVSSP
jgi:hypothetical protein